VGAEAKSIRIRIGADVRLAAAAGGAARYFADAAGMESAAIAQWQTAIVAACEEALEHVTHGDGFLEVMLTRLADRVEVALSTEGDAAPAIGLDSLAGFVSRRGGVESQNAAGSTVLRGVDRVQYETHDGVATTRLTKYIAASTPRCQ
jgi:hypothetical protein